MKWHFASAVLLVSQGWAESVREPNSFARQQQVSPSSVPSHSSKDDVERQLHHKSKGRFPAPPPPIPPPVGVVVPPVVPVPAHPIISCPPEYSLVDNRCVMTEVVPPSFVCPPGTELVAGRCTQFTRPRRECPMGYQLSGARCVASDTLPVEFVCPEGILDATGMSCKVSQSVGLQCPAGYQLDAEAGDCVQTFSAKAACDDDFSKTKHKCIKQSKQRALLVCPEGSELEKGGKKCFALKKAKSKCPKGFTLSHQSARCLRKLKKVLAACPPGFEEFPHHKSICERVLVSPPHLACPAGSELDVASGQCLAQVAPRLSCPTGFTLAEDMPSTCVRVAPEVAFCPPGTQQVGFGPSVRCQTSIDHEIVECCPPGFLLVEGRCQREEFLPAACADNCFTIGSVAPTYSCPDGYRVDRNMCIAVEPINPCLDNSYDSGSSSLRLASEQQQNEQKPSQCEPPAAPYPPTLPAEIVCPHGSSFDGKTCINRSPLPPANMCQTGEFDPMTGKCRRLIFVPVKSECPIGTTRIGSRCVEYEDHKPLFDCPEDAEPDSKGNCVVRQPAIASPAASLASAPMPVCPNGAMDVGNMCRAFERVPRQLICPPNSTPGGGIHDEFGDSDKYCMEFAPLEDGPFLKKYLKPKFVCPDGQPTRGKHCYSVDKSVPTFSCPEGTEQRHSLCIRRMAAVAGGLQSLTSPAIPICPAGTIVQGNRCIVTKEVEPIVTCPPGFLLEPGAPNDRACARYSENMIVCPTGTLQTADGCLRERVTPPNVEAAPVIPCLSGPC